MSNASAPAAGYRSLFIAAPDGLRLHVREYGPPDAVAVPVICLPGLTRNSADFDTLAGRLAVDPDQPRRVIAIDLRGRGHSQHDADPARYNLAVELADILAVIAALELPPAIFVGTSRGGLLTMLMAATQPGALAGAVLNDIGPVIEPQGLDRIRGYVGRLTLPASFQDGARMLRGLFGAHFTRFTDADWLAHARRSWLQDSDGRPAQSYDPGLAATLAPPDPQQPLPQLWEQFGALAGVPVMTIRGENSDLLAADTLRQMQALRPDMATLAIAGEGHAPVLEGDTANAVAAFVARIRG
jgi:pimeloyl-ACP methyl ester carboxylesterase